MNHLLQFMTCGSVDDGKSTLIGHMLYDAKLIFADQEEALKMDSLMGAAGGGIDYSLLLDGLVAEREQGITIDVAYRYFSTDRRSFIVADTPGHEEYTRNMAVGASFARLAVILVDAVKGIRIQTMRHLRICLLMGIRHFVFAINKMDEAGYDQRVYDSICAQLKKNCSGFVMDSVSYIPVSAKRGDFVTKASDRMPWYKGKPLLKYLEEIDTERADDQNGFILPVQRVSRPDESFRGFMGQIAHGRIKAGDRIRVYPSGEEAGVSGILCSGAEVTEAKRGDPVTLILDSEVDVSRGCVLGKDAGLLNGTEILADILWMDEHRLVRGRNYLLKLATQTIPVTVSELVYKIDINTGEHLQADEAEKNELVTCVLELSSELLFLPFSDSVEMGGFILIDRLTNATAGCGTIIEKRRRRRNLTRQVVDVDRSAREAALGQKAITIWFTGLSGAGKSAIGNALEVRLHEIGRHTMLLDGDNVRMGLNRDLGFSETDRAENIRRVAEVAKLLNDAGIIVVTTFISPLASDRHNAREIIGEGFHEVYVNTPLEVCEMRDVKGLYKRARAGEIDHFTGLTSPYEVPEAPDLILDTGCLGIEESVDLIIEKFGL